MEKKIRRAQTIQPFGIGSIVDINGEGFVVKDISEWSNKPKKNIKLSRLQRVIGQKKLLSFSDSSSKNESVSVTRFPKTYHCPRCKVLRSITGREDKETEGASPVCTNSACSNQPMTPMRFVAYCDNGHLSEINWAMWAHLKSEPAKTGFCEDKNQLYFHTHGGGDFDQMIVECKACGARNDLADMMAGTPIPRGLVFTKGQNCSGKQPWQYGYELTVSCDERMKVEPRGSSSIYRGNVISALDIEADVSNENDTVIDPSELKGTIDKIIDITGSSQLAIDELEEPDSAHEMRLVFLAENFEVSVEDVRKAMIKELKKIGKTSLISETVEADDIQQRLLVDELSLFSKHIDVSLPNLNICFNRTDQQDGSMLSKLFSFIGEVRKLREIRALVSFTRGKGNAKVPVDIPGTQDWIPAVESFGEGIYFELNPVTIKQFFTKHLTEIQNVTAYQIESLNRLKENYRIEIPDSELFIIAHTISHLMIRQLTFDSGYSSSSLRERIFVDPDANYAGILIYTSDADVEGTLGGLVDQARLDRLETTVTKAIESCIWCSADPVCRETVNQGFAGLNRSACHCCSLISETSCMYQNAMLNRLVLGGFGVEKSEPLGLINFMRTLE